MSTLIWGTQRKYGEYEITGARENRPRLLGEGSFGKTFEAFRSDRVAGEEIKEFVAIKVLNPELLNSESKRVQFIQELLALTKFKHSNLIHYIRCGEEEGEVYYAMELCRGGDLSHLVRRYGALSEKVAALIGLQVAAGLREVHQRHRLVHRDIKPSNIMLVDEIEPELERKNLAYRFEQQDSLCRVVDFGLVDFAINAEVAPQRFVGSPAFASPEQIRERPVDGRSDIYSLGMTLWYLVQGGGPLLDAAGTEIRDPREAIRRHTSPEEHEGDFPSYFSTEFRALLARMVAKRPEQRFPTAAELQNALRQFISTAQDGDEVKFSVTRLSEPLDTVYELGEKIPSRGPNQSYAAREKAGGQRVKVSVVANVDAGSSSDEVSAVAGRLCSLAELSRQPTLPPAIVPVRAVIWAADLLAYTEEMFPHIALSDVLKARATAKRPINFPEAVSILRPIAEALDFLLVHKQETVSLPCEDVWLTGPAVASIPLDTQVLASPLNTWEGLQVRFSMMYLPPKESEEDGSESCFGRTMAGSLQLSGADLHPVPAFARLVYRILNGAEVAAAVQFAPNAYVPAVTLSHASNNLIRDLLCRKRPWENPTAVLKELCANEGVVWRAASSPAVARIVAPGVVQSPHATAGATQSLPWDQWVPGGEFVCSESGRKVILPMNLPPRENVAPAASSEGLPGPRVSSFPAPALRGGAPIDAARRSHAAASHAAASQAAASHAAPPVIQRPAPVPLPVALPVPVTPMAVKPRPVPLVPVQPPAQAAPPPPVVPPALPAKPLGERFAPALAFARAKPIPVVAGAAVAFLLFVGLIWHFVGGSKPAEISVVPSKPQPVAESSPATPAPVIAPVPVAPAVAQTEPFRPGEKWENSLGMKFVPIPGTGAVIGIWPARQSDFAAFIKANGYEAEGDMLSYDPSGWKQAGATWKDPGFAQTPAHPVVGVSADDAKAFCHWLTQKERDAHLIDETQAYRLPSDDEWTRAASTTKYPWGSAWPPPNNAGNFASEEAVAHLKMSDVIPGYRDGFAATSPVASFSANAYGIYDMGGNVDQWCDTVFHKEMNPEEVRLKDPRLDDEGGAEGKLVLRGSSFSESSPDALSTGYRQGAKPSTRAANVGFRCVLAPVVQTPVADQPPAAPDAGKPADAPAAAPAAPDAPAPAADAAADADAAKKDAADGHKGSGGSSTRHHTPSSGSTQRSGRKPGGIIDHIVKFFH